MRKWIIKKLGIKKLIEKAIDRNVTNRYQIRNEVKSFLEQAILDNYQTLGVNNYLKKLISDVHAAEYEEKIQSHILKFTKELNSEEFLDKIIARIKNKQLD